MMEAVSTTETLVNYYHIHAATTQKTAIFVLTAVRTSNPTLGEQFEPLNVNYSPVREAERDGVDNPERLLHHVAEVESRYQLLLPGRPSSGVRCEDAAQFALARSLTPLLVL
jgi:hypothetical protein